MNSGSWLGKTGLYDSTCGRKDIYIPLEITTLKKKNDNNKNTNLGELVLTSHTSRDKNALLLSFRTVIDSCQSDNKLRGNIVVYLTP